MMRQTIIMYKLFVKLIDIEKGMKIMKGLLKQIYWKLPINKEIKEKISKKRYERILRKEEEEDKSKIISIIEDSSELHSYSKFILDQYGKKSDMYTHYKKQRDKKQSVNLAAYYLTQFHPNEKNDEWWGKGTTEWNNVNQAIPQFVDHYQPRRPGELGYYDLRLKENMMRQIEIAQNYGVNIFCFYYYWFDGERLLEQPLNMFLENKDLDIQFCYCWANENWTKRFSGTDEGILMGITQTTESYEAFIDSVLQDMMDNRYYRIDNKPVISVYRPSQIPCPEKVLKVWRKKAKDILGVDLYLIAVQERDTSIDWSEIGFDAETEFQPKQIQHKCKEINNLVKTIRKDFAGNIYDYEDLVLNKKYLISTNLNKKVYPAVMPMWDNTARRNFRGTIFHGSTPELYKVWLSDIVKKMMKKTNLDDKLIFINAWNEWGEGAYLEPDYYYGFSYLQATRDALDE